MCGRFTQRAEPKRIAEQFKLFELPQWRPRYNIAPTQPVLAVLRCADGRREGRALRWGLIPSWAKDAAVGNRMINARAETVATKPAFRSSFKRRRCLIPADGFYEWKKAGKAKQPYFIHLANGALFAFAGLWDHWQDGDGHEVDSCTILTTDANGTVKPIHDRMPVLVAAEAYGRWLDPEADPATLASLLTAYPADQMAAYPVSRHVNTPAHDDPQCIEPVDAGLF